MHATRREALGAAALTAAGALFARRGGAIEAKPPEADFSSGDWASVREQFGLDDERVHLSGFLLASHPAPVRRAIEEHRRALNDDPTTYVNRNNRRLLTRSRTAAASYLGASSHDVMLTDSTTQGLGLLYGGMRIGEGEEILTSTHDHYATHASLQFASQRTGAKLRYAPLYKDISSVSADEIVGTLKKEIRDETRIVALTYVHSSTGLMLPLARLARVVREANVGRPRDERALLCVDAVHALGIEPIDVTALGVDVLVAGTHKSLFGPRGTGIGWCHPRAQARFRPTIPTFTSGEGWGGNMSPGGFHAFEHRWALADAFHFQTRLGPSKVSKRVHALARKLKEGLAAMPHVTVATPLDDELSAGIVSFDVKRRSHGNVVRALRRQGIIATVAPYEDAYVRLAPSIFNSDEDIGRALAEVSALR